MWSHADVARPCREQTAIFTQAQEHAGSAEELKGLTGLPYGAAYGKTMYAGGLKETDVQYVYIEDNNNKIKDTLFVEYFFF